MPGDVTMMSFYIKQCHSEVGLWCGVGGSGVVGKPLGVAVGVRGRWMSIAGEWWVARGSGRVRWAHEHGGLKVGGCTSIAMAPSPRGWGKSAMSIGRRLAE